MLTRRSQCRVSCARSGYPECRFFWGTAVPILPIRLLQVVDGRADELWSNAAFRSHPFWTRRISGQLAHRGIDSKGYPICIPYCLDLLDKIGVEVVGTDDL